jgi:hypothetical protein
VIARPFLKTSTLRKKNSAVSVIVHLSAEILPPLVCTITCAMGDLDRLRIKVIFGSVQMNDVNFGASSKWRKRTGLGAVRLINGIFRFKRRRITIKNRLLNEPMTPVTKPFKIPTISVPLERCYWVVEELLLAGAYPGKLIATLIENESLGCGERECEPSST